jgi:3-oxoacyl-[acyl-carrier protein] reductase
MQNELNGQVALVTGATRGIGEAIALALARDGATVVGTATTDDGAAKISAYLAAAGNAGTGVTLDVTDSAAIDSVLADIEKRYGAIGILVNNAGITRDNLMLRMKDDEWDAVMATNLRPAFRLAKAVLRGMMKARAGRIIQIGSVVGTSGNPGQANYAAAKAALVGFTKSLAQEIGSRNITVNCVAPGFIDTDMTEGVARGDTRGAAGQDSARAPGLTVRRRRRSGVPRRSTCRLHHRRDAARERRHVHGLSDFGRGCRRRPATAFLYNPPAKF